jgi:hypothetical protein
MDYNDFQSYYKTPTKLMKNVLKTLALLFYHPPCLPHYATPCNHHHPLKTFLPQYIINGPHTLPNQRTPTINPLFHPQYPLPPQYIINNLAQFPVQNIIAHKEHKILD